MNTKLHVVADTRERPIRLFMTAGQVSDYTGASALLNSLPPADWLFSGGARLRRGLVPLSLCRKEDNALPVWPEVTRQARQIRQAPLPQGNWIEIMFGRLTDWRRVATRYDRSPRSFSQPTLSLGPRSFGCEARAYSTIARSSHLKREGYRSDRLVPTCND